MFVPTASLSRQVSAVRKHTLTLSLLDQPNVMAETLERLNQVNGKQIVPADLAAMPYGIAPIGRPFHRAAPRRLQDLEAEICVAAEVLRNWLSCSLKWHRLSAGMEAQ